MAERTAGTSIKGNLEAYRWVALLLAFVAQMSNALGSWALAPLAPLFQPELGLTKAEVGIFSSAVFLGSWVLLLPSGFLTDRLGVRRVMSLGQVLAGVFMLGMGMVGSFLQAVAVMFAVGLGRAAVAPGVSKAVMEWFSFSERATAMGLKQTAVPLAGVVAASVLPALGLAVGWRNALALVGLWIIANAALTFLFYRDARVSLHPVARGESSRQGLLQVIRSRTLWSVSVIALLFGMVQIAITSYLALYFTEIVLVEEVPDHATRIVAAGGYLALTQVGGIIGRVGWGVASDRLLHGRRMAVLAVIAAFSAASLTAVAYLAPGYPLWLLTAMVVLCGAGTIGWAGIYQATIVETAGIKLAGIGVGVSMSVMQWGNILGAPFFGLLVDLSHSYRAAWLSFAGICVLATVLAAVSAREEKRPAISG